MTLLTILFVWLLVGFILLQGRTNQAELRAGTEELWTKYYRHQPRWLVELFLCVVFMLLWPASIKIRIYRK